MSIIRNHPNGLCYISHRLKMVCVTVPKNASTTISKRLLGLGFIATSMYNDDFVADETYDDYFWWTVLRDPLERFASGYDEYVRRHRYTYQSHSIDHVIENLETDRDAHLERQAFFLGGRMFNYVASVETLDAGMAEIERLTGVKILPWEKKNVIKRGVSILDCMTYEQKRDVEIFYGVDGALYRGPYLIIKTKTEKGEEHE